MWCIVGGQQRFLKLNLDCIFSGISFLLLLRVIFFSSVKVVSHSKYTLFFLLFLQKYDPKLVDKELLGKTTGLLLWR